MILITRCYSNAKLESPEGGDSGFLIENEPCSFSELVEYLKAHTEPSCSNPTGDTREWYSTGYNCVDFADGIERETSVHYSRRNPSRMDKYWRKAAIIAGIVKP